MLRGYRQLRDNVYPKRSVKYPTLLVTILIKECWPSVPRYFSGGLARRVVARQF